MNIKFARKLVVRLRKRAETLKGVGPCDLMEAWHLDIKGCGTVGCISGEAALLYNELMTRRSRKSKMLGMSEGQVALGLDNYAPLFFLGAWESDYHREAFCNTKTATAEMNVMADYLEWFTDREEAAAKGSV